MQSNADTDKTAFLSKHPASWRLLIVFIVFAGVHGLLAIYSSVNKSMTMDEGIHLTGGVSFNAYNDYRIVPETGNVPRRLAAIPAMLVQSTRPSTDDTFWKTGNGWRTSDLFIYRDLQEPMWTIFLGRCLILLFNIGILFGVFKWSASLWGERGSYFSLVFAALSPSLIAHGSIITSDAAATALYFLSCFTIWLLFNKVSLKHFIYSGLCAGLLCLSKFTCVLLVPYILCMIAYKVASPNPLKLKLWGISNRLSKKSHKLMTLAGCSLALGIFMCFSIWLGYGFRYSGLNPALPEGQYRVSWTELDTQSGFVGEVVGEMREHKMLPEAFLYGFLHTYVHSKSRSNYFFGEHDSEGSWLFFPFLFATKTPIPTLIALVLSLFLLINKRLKKELDWDRLVPIIVAPAILAVVAVSSNLNIGHRHILPIYPFLFVLIGVVGAELFLTKKGRWINYSFVLLLAIGHVNTYPNYLSFFNGLIGGPRNAHHYVIDSSIDWGQDIGRLSDWLNHHNKENTPEYYALFTQASPSYWGLDGVFLKSHGNIELDDRQAPNRLKPGIYCVSVTMLQGGYAPRFIGPDEAMYKRLNELSSLFDYLIRMNAFDDLQSEKRIPSLSPREWAELIEEFNHLRFAALRKYLLEKRPSAVVGDSIKIYFLSAQDLLDSRCAPYVGTEEPIRRIEFFNHYIMSQMSEDHIVD